MSTLNSLINSVPFPLTGRGTRTHQPVKLNIMEDRLILIAQKHNAEVFAFDNFWVVTDSNYVLMKALENSGFTVEEGVDISGADVLVVNC